MAILEALACGVPVVISGECHFPEVAEAGAGTIVPLEAVAISNALLHLLDDERRHFQASEAAKELVHTRYDWMKIARDMVAAYELT